MKLPYRRSIVIAMASLLWISGGIAAELPVVLKSATAGHDERTGKPLLNLVFAETSMERLRIFYAANLGKPVELRADGRTVLRSVIREPIMVAHVQLSDPDWTDQSVIDLARQLSDVPRGEVELRSASSSSD
jgi:hypothetical protein